MKKLIAVVSLMFAAMIATGCGNSPDGDSQRISNVTVSPKL